MVTLPDMQSRIPTNPRRTSPQLSVSLPGNKRQKIDHASLNQGASSSRLGVLQPSQRHSQGSGSDQSASRWFDNVNRHVSQSVQGNTACDDEPPFFMANQHNDKPAQLPLSDSSGLIFGAHSRLDSENEDLRGVIDDLTVENKKLRHILRSNRSHRASPSTDSQDKLFEVRMHGLPAEKRRELEFLLKNFATSLHTTAPSMTHSNSGSGVSSNSLPGSKLKTDSGYASNSNSGQTSLSANGAVVRSSKRSRDKSIKNYLHEIPDTLLPRQNPIMMSERAKMALVVRRLEQLFTGKSAAPGEHSQPLQQQEVSQMAARADAKTSRKRAAEGTREAHILPPDSKVNFDAIDPFSERRAQPAQKPAASSDALSTEPAIPVISVPGSPDQRPTRPLDLDIHRAQVAEENIQYIRHLGLSSPRMEPAAGAKERSWMYLNLLVNMAQLHTINVTPAFVRGAIKKVSTKFELSKDGNRVRWIGGPGGTVFSKEEEKALECVDNVNTSSEDSTEDGVTGGSSSKRSKTDSTSNAVVSNTVSEDKTSGLNTSSGSKQQISSGATSNQQSSNVTKSTQVRSAFDYQPLIYRPRPQGEEEILFQDSDSSHDSLSRDSSSLVHALSRSNLNQQKRSDEGLITFYNNPHFCSDYSGDKNPTNMKKEAAVDAGQVVGVATFEVCESPLRYGDACYFTTLFAPPPYQPQEKEVIPVLTLPDLSLTADREKEPIELSCSGVGGVFPEDNFAIDVKILRQAVQAEQRGAMRGTTETKRSKVAPSYTYEVLEQRTLDLLPPRLPPANYIFFTSSSSSGNLDMDDSEDDSDETSLSADDDHVPPPTFMRLWSAGSSGNNLDGDLEEEGDNDDSSSVDMLAMARAVDPTTIAEQERQYVINEPGTRAIAGSLAATVGASGSSPSRQGGESHADMASQMEFDEGDEDDSMDEEDE